MKVNRETHRKMEGLASKSNIELNAETFTYLSCECLADEIIDLLELNHCNVRDIKVLLPLLEEKLSECYIKKEDKLSSVREKTK